MFLNVYDITIINSNNMEVLKMAKIIDAHMHISNWQDSDGKLTVDILKEYCQNMKIDSVVDMCCSNNGNLLSWGMQPDQCVLAAIMKYQLPQTYVFGCLLFPDMVKGEAPKEFDFKYQVEMLDAMGFDGFKICEFKPDSYKINNMERLLVDYEPYLTYCEEHDIPMCWHVADPDCFWDPEMVSDDVKQRGWFYGDPSYPQYDYLQKIAYQLLDRHPKLRVMLAHAFFISEYPERMIALLEKYPNVTIDLAPGWEMFAGFKHHYEKWYEIFRKYSNRFLFATDTGLGNIGYATLLAENELRFLKTTDEFETPGNYQTRGIALEKEHLDKILSGNCVKMLGEQPKPLDKNIFKEYCKTFMPYIPDSKNKPEIEKFLKNNIY